MGISKSNSKRVNLYDNLVFCLLVWCIFQDFVLCIVLRLTDMVILTKMMFFSKDILMLALFAYGMIKNRLPKHFFLVSVVYYFIIFVQIIVAFVNKSENISITSILSSVRGVILLPTLTIIGYFINDKQAFVKRVKKYYWIVAVIALIGIVEFICDKVFGTKSFWMDFLKLEDYYVRIKGQPGGIENGTPGNWYTDIGKGYRTQKRLISIWAAPLTAGFVLLLPSVYYTINFFKNIVESKTLLNKKFWMDLILLITCVLAFTLTFTRQTLLPFLLIVFFVFLYFNKKNRKIIIICTVAIGVLFVILFREKIFDYVFNGSTKVHILRIKESLSKINFWGSGMASFGTRFSGSIATESQYITLIGQAGVIAILPYMYFLIYPIICCIKQINRINNEDKYLIISLCLSGFVVMLAGIISETVAAFTSIAQYYILIGLAWGYSEKYKEKIDDENKNYSNVSTTISQNS